MSFSFRMKVIGSVVTVTAAQCALITANDEWPEVQHWLSKTFLGGARASTSSLGKDKKKVVILGSGWGALATIQTLDPENCELTVVSPRPFFFYTPLLAGMAAGNVSYSSILEPIRKHLAGFPNANYIQAECSAVKFMEQAVTVQKSNNDGDSLRTVEIDVPYDQLLIAVGAEPATFNIPGVRERCMFIKEIDDGIKIHHKVLDSLEYANTLVASGAPDSEIDEVLHWVIIGGGPTGVELTAELNDFVRCDVSRYFPNLRDRIKITLMEATGSLLGMFDPAVSAYATSVLTDNGASILCNAMVTKVEGNTVHYKTKTYNEAGKEETSLRMINCGTLVWAGGINTRPLTRDITSQINKLYEDRRESDIKLQTSPRGIVVDSKFRVKGFEKESNIFAIGDCAVVKGCSPTAQSAYQQGKYLGRLLRETHIDSSQDCETIVTKHKDFNFHNYGALAYVGTSKGVAELKTVLWNNPLEVLKNMKQDQAGEEGDNISSTIVEGSSAFVIWRSLYFSKLLSHRNKFQVGFDWMKSGIFGRDISSPYEISSMTKDTSNKKS